MNRYYYIDRLKEENELFQMYLLIALALLVLLFLRNFWNWYQKGKYRDRFKALNVAFENLSQIADDLEESEKKTLKKNKGLSLLVKELKDSKLASLKNFRKKEQELIKRKLADKEKYEHELENFNYERLFYKERIKHNEVQASNTRLSAHFLKNVLFSIQMEYDEQMQYKFNLFSKTIIIEKKNNKSILPNDVLTKLNKLLDYNVSTINERKVDLSIEVKHLKLFLEIIQFLKPKLKIINNFKADYSDIRISPTLLFPFVENALKHGNFNIDKSFLNLDLNVIEDSISYKVINTAFEKDEKESNKNFGLKSLEKALITYYKSYELNVKLAQNKFVANLKVTL